MTGLAVLRASELPVCPPDHRWLIEDLWADEAGIVGGEPKCGKSFLALALDMVVAVAAGDTDGGREGRPRLCARQAVARSS
jgi:hypothetical protein